MTTNTVKVTRISSSNRKEPLNDLNTLSLIGKSATKTARLRAFSHGASVTIAENGKVYRLSADGSKTFVRDINKTSSFPTIEEDLCQA